MSREMCGPVPALALLAGGLTPAAAAPAASRQTPAPASTAAGHSRAPGGGERHAPSHARDTARCPCIADIPRSRDAPSPDRGNDSRRTPIPGPLAPASRSLSRVHARRAWGAMGDLQDQETDLPCGTITAGSRARWTWLLG